MNLESHVFISSLVHDEISKIFPIIVSRKFFRAGNVLADYSPLVWTHPHYFTVSWNFVTKYIDRVCSLGTDEDAMDPDKHLSFQLGIICHYITDFFCRAHIGSGIGPKREHLQYEDFLDNYRNSVARDLRNYNWLNNFEPYTSVSDVKANLKANVERYRDLPASPERDIKMALENCVQVMVSILSIRLTQAVRKDIFKLHRYPLLSYELPKFSSEELIHLLKNKNYTKVLRAIKSGNEED